MYDLSARGLVSRPELEAAENDYAEASRRFQAEGEATGSRGGQDSEMKINAARLHAARARQAEADVARTRYNLTQTILTSPIAGIVTTVSAQVGEKVREGHTVAEIVDISRVKVKGDLSPGLLPFVFVGQAAKVTVNTVPPTALAASVEQFQRIADPKTQALAVTFTLPNPDYKFQPGFSAQVELPVKQESLQ